LVRTLQRAGPATTPFYFVVLVNNSYYAIDRYAIENLLNEKVKEKAWKDCQELAFR
jgi:hypothetical protein